LEKDITKIIPLSIKKGVNIDCPSFKNEAYLICLGMKVIELRKYEISRSRIA
jgi:hypothetical protein